MSSHLDYDYDFVPPLDAPTFIPTMEEFKVVLEYEFIPNYLFSFFLSRTSLPITRRSA